MRSRHSPKRAVNRPPMTTWTPPGSDLSVPDHLPRILLAQDTGLIGQFRPGVIRMSDMLSPGLWVDR